MSKKATNNSQCMEHFMNDLVKYYKICANTEGLASFLNLYFNNYNFIEISNLLDNSYPLLLILYYIDCCNSDIEIYNTLTQLGYKELISLTYPISSINHWNIKLSNTTKKDIEEITKSFTKMVNDIYITGTESNLHFFLQNEID